MEPRACRRQLEWRIEEFRENFLLHPLECADIIYSPPYKDHSAQVFDMVGISQMGGLSGVVSVEDVRSLLSLVEIRRS